MAVIHKIGRRKTAVARVYVSEGTGKITVNKKEFATYFPTATLQYKVLQPMSLTENVNNFDVIIDTPGEYAETNQLSGALAVYGCEADVIGLLMSAIEPFSLYPPNIVSVSNREVVGVVTKCDHWAANPELAAEWLRLAGCKKIFFTSSYTGEGIAEILSYLKEPVDKLPWEVAKAEYDKLGFGPGESEKHTLRI